MQSSGTSVAAGHRCSPSGPSSTAGATASTIVRSTWRWSCSAWSPAQASGVLFTADPVTGNRKVASVEAVVGLGDALVSGVVNADGYQVRDGDVVATSIAAEHQPALTDAQVVRLVHLGRRVEAHFGRPQDIEWCLLDDDFQFVQSRPITTLFPIPAGGDDGANHVYISVGHQQMMTDPMKPLGLSMWQLTARPPMHEAAGRLFVDVAQGLASPASRAGLLDALARADPLIGDALQTSSTAATSSRSSRTRVLLHRRPAVHPPRSTPIRPSSPS